MKRVIKKKAGLIANRRGYSSIQSRTSHTQWRMRKQEILSVAQSDPFWRRRQTIPVTVAPARANTISAPSLFFNLSFPQGLEVQP